MPFKSKAQQRYMYATNPKVAKEMSSKMTHKMFIGLPEKSSKKDKGKKSKMKTMLAALKMMSEK